MNVCFVANFSKTYLFHEIALQLKSQGISVVWIVVNKKLYRFLQQHYKEDSILYLPKDFVNRDNVPVGDLCINEILFGDRVWKYDMTAGKRYLTNIQADIRDFLVTHRVKLVFGEHTWAHELVVRRLALKMGIRFLEPHVMRIPNGRFGFFEGESHEQLFETSGDSTITDIDIFRMEKPGYLGLNNALIRKQKSLNGRVSKVKKFFTNENIDKDDPTHISRQLLRFRLRSQEEINKETYAFVKTVSFEEVRHHKYVLVTLHVQPESTIDVFGRYYEDQKLNIINLWRKLPEDWKMVIKEHSNALGNRRLRFYKSLKKFPGILFVDERTDSHVLINHAELVITVAGTIAYEAALLKIPSVVLAPVFFSQLSYCSHRTLKDVSESETLQDWVDEITSKEDNRRQFCNYVMANSFEGNMTDPESDPSVLDPENVDRLSAAFIAVIRNRQLSNVY
ncbi:MAG: hypothetical protein K0Q66_374 [Chitinophagaceae bacterium]|jgi:hypothetical protein|nr:hypothetical protein [Chitinophagaceae bacterium]